jgi:CheY-like chemotaxis protein
MLQRSLGLSEEAMNMAEGSPGPAEQNEPETPLKTTTVPAVVESDAISASAETGVLSVVESSAEGQDDGDSQDASLTTSETKSVPETDKDGHHKTEKVPVVLIIEDTTELAEVIQATLERMNIVVSHEAHGKRALEKMSDIKPDLVLLDINLPDMTGWEIMDALKEQNEKAVAGEATMPIIIVITALDDPANRLVGKLQGIYNYLIKPFTSDDIEKVVSQALNTTTSS